jgi:hypothetical protein
MARFEHSRFSAIEFQGEGDARPWAKFTPERRSFGEHTIHVGVLETNDEKVISRLREAIKRGSDPHLSEVGAQASDELDGLDKDALLKLAEDEGVEVDKRWGEKKIAAAIRDGRE